MLTTAATIPSGCAAPATAAAPVADLLAGARAMVAVAGGHRPVRPRDRRERRPRRHPHLRRLAHRPAALRRQRPGGRDRPPRRRRRAGVVVARRPRRQPPARPLLGDDGAPLARHADRFQALAAYLLVDPTLAVGVDGYERSTDPDQRPPPLPGRRRRPLGGLADGHRRRRHRRHPPPRRPAPRARRPAVPRRRGRHPRPRAGPLPTPPPSPAGRRRRGRCTRCHCTSGPVLAIAAGTVAGLRVEGPRGSHDERLDRRRPRRCRQLPVPHQHARRRRPRRGARRDRTGRPVRRARSPSPHWRRRRSRGLVAGRGPPPPLPPSPPRRVSSSPGAPALVPRRHASSACRPCGC